MVKESPQDTFGSSILALGRVKQSQQTPTMQRHGLILAHRPILLAPTSKTIATHIVAKGKTGTLLAACCLLKETCQKTQLQAPPGRKQCARFRLKMNRKRDRNAPQTAISKEGRTH